MTRSNFFVDYINNHCSISLKRCSSISLRMVDYPACTQHEHDFKSSKSSICNVQFPAVATLITYPLYIAVKYKQEVEQKKKKDSTLYVVPYIRKKKATHALY